MAKKIHWTQTDEGRKRMAEITRKVRKAKKAMRKETKHLFTLSITGKDTLTVLSFLSHHAHKEQWNVQIKTERN